MNAALLLTHIEGYMGSHIDAARESNAAADSSTKNNIETNPSLLSPLMSFPSYPKRPRPQSPPGYPSVDTSRDDGIGEIQSSVGRALRRRNDNNTKKAANSNEPVNPYRVLQVRKDATQSEIKHAYKRLALWHHPGRLHENSNECSRRYNVFETLAACCETLLESDARKRLDRLLKSKESKPSTTTATVTFKQQPQDQQQLLQHQNLSNNENPQEALAPPHQHQMQQEQKHPTITESPTNESVLSGSILTLLSSPFVDNAQPQKEEQKRDNDMIPPLSRVSSGESSVDEKEENSVLTQHNPGMVGEENDNHHFHSHIDPQQLPLSRSMSTGSTVTDYRFNLQSNGMISTVPSVIGLSSSSSEEEAYNHYTAVETDRLFGGPLALLYRARNFRKFTDPFVFFERIFGSAVFSKRAPSTNQHALTNTTLKESTGKNRSSVWSVSSNTLSDGKIVHETSRILHNRKLTKTETITYNPETGKKHSQITITSEILEEDQPTNDKTQPDYSSSDCLVLSLDGCLDDVEGACTPCHSVGCVDGCTPCRCNNTNNNSGGSQHNRESLDDNLISFLFFPPTSAAEDADSDSFQDYCGRWQEFLTCGCGDTFSNVLSLEPSQSSRAAAT